MILPKAKSKSELYLQVQNQLRVQNRQLISQLLCNDRFLQSDSEEKVLTNNVNLASQTKTFENNRIQDISLKKSTKKRFENAATNTEGSSCSDDGYRSGSVQQSPKNYDTKMTKNQNIDNLINTNEDSNLQTQINDSNQPKNIDQTATCKKEVSKVKNLRPQSPFHRDCGPKEPSRDFIAKPIPPNLLVTGSHIKTRGNVRSISSSPNRVRFNSTSQPKLKGILKRNVNNQIDERQINKINNVSRNQNNRATEEESQSPTNYSSSKCYECCKQKYFAYCFYCAQKDSPELSIDMTQNISLQQQQQQQKQDQQQKKLCQHQEKHFHSYHGVGEKSNFDVLHQCQHQPQFQSCPNKKYPSSLEQDQDTNSGWRNNVSKLESKSSQEKLCSERRPLEIRSTSKSRIGSKPHPSKPHNSQQRENTKFMQMNDYGFFGSSSPRAQSSSTFKYQVQPHARGRPVSKCSSSQVRASSQAQPKSTSQFLSQARASSQVTPKSPTQFPSHGKHFAQGPDTSQVQARSPNQFATFSKPFLQFCYLPDSRLTSPAKHTPDFKLQQQYNQVNTPNNVQEAVHSDVYVCTQCHCESCYKNYKPVKPTNKIKSGLASSSGYHQDFKSHFTSFNQPEDSSKMQVSVPWTEDWFKDLVNFRKKEFWDCHAETTKI